MHSSFAIARVVRHTMQCSYAVISRKYFEFINLWPYHQVTFTGHFYRSRFMVKP